MTPETPANGKYFTKEEVVSRMMTGLTGQDRETALATIQVLFDGVEHAPIETLLFLCANRLGMINGQTISCDEAANVLRNTAIISKLGMLIAAEHNESHNKG